MILMHFKPISLFPLALAVSISACWKDTETSDQSTGAAPASQASPPEVTPAALANALENPGIDLWFGDEAAGIDREQMIAKFPLYAIHHERYAISGENLSQLRKQRETTIVALRERIESATKAAMVLPSADTVTPSLESELTIALDLNAVELLDLLTGAAMQLQTFLANYESGTLDTYIATSHARLHRNLLGAISGILKQEGFSPVVNEEWESNFTFEKAQGDSAFNLLDDSAFADETSPDIPIGGLAPFTTSFSQRLIEWSQTYLSETPAAQRKGEMGMEHPVPALR
ncbi:MAG: hypothetical protein KDN22_02045 [Verrucomicrobiae bacterium]|nr:hypothetical protein [Verrucomicrobiae bacterium]